MKKRTFIPLSISLALFVLFLTAIFIAGAYAIIYCAIKQPQDFQIYHYIIATIALIFVGYTIIRMSFALTISLKKSEIKTYGDGLPKFEKIQYKCSIDYKEIKDVAIIASEKNSLNKKISFKWVSSSMPKKYLEFTLVNDYKKRMCINYYNKRQIIKMLSYINLNMQATGNPYELNVNEIMKDWYIFDGYNREDLKIKRGEKIRKKNKKDKL